MFLRPQKLRVPDRSKALESKKAILTTSRETREKNATIFAGMTESQIQAIINAKKQELLDMIEQSEELSMIHSTESLSQVGYNEDTNEGYAIAKIKEDDEFKVVYESYSKNVSGTTTHYYKDYTDEGQFIEPGEDTEG